MRPDGMHLAAMLGVLAVWAIVIGAVIAGVVLLVRYMRKRSRMQEEILAEMRKRNEG